jgi:hypothetical protein
MSEHTELPWIYRPYEYDDWGFIRSALDGSLVAVARRMSESIKTDDEHRHDKTDPYGANAAFIVKACNSYDGLVAALQEIVDTAEEHSYPWKVARTALAAAGMKP